MDDADIRRLRKEVNRRYKGMPHRLWMWRQLLDQFGEDVEIRREPRKTIERPSIGRIEGIAEVGGSSLSPTGPPND